MRFIINKINQIVNTPKEPKVPNPAIIEKVEKRNDTTILDLVRYANENPDRTCWEVIWDCIGRGNITREDCVKLGDIVRRKRNGYNPKASEAH